MTGTPIRVLLVDDSLIALAVLTQMLSTSPDVKVVGTARNGKEALSLIPILNPTVVCTDLKMPVMDGLELTRAIMADHPLPILVVSSLVQKEQTSTIFHLLEAGAIDVYPKPAAGLHIDSRVAADDLIKKIKLISGVIPIRKRHAPASVSGSVLRGGNCETAIRAVAIGTSVGGPQALNTIFRALPKTFPVPILCVQHMGMGFLQGLINWLSLESKLRIKIAEVGEQPLPGIVYFPQEGAHLTVNVKGLLECLQDAPVHGHRPSVTVTFKSVADFYRGSVVGVLLTGMGEDGADGLKAIADAGGLTIAQDEQTSVVFGMPGHAIEMGAAQYVLPIGKIAETLLSQVGKTHCEYSSSNRQPR